MAKDTLVIDFGKEKDVGGGRVKWPEGDYHVKVLKVKAGRSSDKDTPGINVMFKVIDGKKKGQKISEDLWITAKSMKRIRQLYAACGINIPKKKVKLPLKRLVGKTLYIEVQDDESGKDKGYDTRSRVAFQGFMSEEEYESDVDEDDDDDIDDDEDDDVEDLDDDEDEDEDEGDLDEDEDEDDEDEDEEPHRKKRRKSKSKSKSKSKKRKKKDDDDDDDDEDLDLDEL